MKPLLIVLLVGVLLGILWLLRNSRANTETTPYKLLRTDGMFELRDYPALMLATTPMKDARGSEAFGHLFGFITGNNAKSEKIPMTTPVLIDPSGATMNFVMPQAVVQRGVPQPGGDVSMHPMQPGRYAVLRFKGNGDEKNQKEALEKLNEWLRTLNIPAESTPLFAYYDPPWTPVFLRRNEVMVRVAKDAK